MKKGHTCYRWTVADSKAWAWIVSSCWTPVPTWASSQCENTQVFFQIWSVLMELFLDSERWKLLRGQQSTAGHSCSITSLVLHSDLHTRRCGLFYCYRCWKSIKVSIHQSRRSYCFNICHHRWKNTISLDFKLHKQIQIKRNHHISRFNQSFYNLLAIFFCAVISVQNKRCSCSKWTKVFYNIIYCYQ